MAVPSRPDVAHIGYGPHEHVIRDGRTFLITKKDEEVPIQVFGAHNLRNISAAREVCKQLGIKGKDFYKAVATFKGAARRLELVRAGATSVVYKDFAHAPSKLRATAQALKQQFPRRRLVACLELHTPSARSTRRFCRSTRTASTRPMWRWCISTRTYWSTSAYPPSRRRPWRRPSSGPICAFLLIARRWPISCTSKPGPTPTCY